MEHFCWQCKKKIPIISSESGMGYCPYCLADLSLTTVTEEKNNLNDRLYEDWKYLLAPHIRNTSNNLNINQLFALKLIYIDEYFNNHKTCDRLLQTARNSKSMETTTHLSIIFKIIRKANISIEDFFNLQIPSEFIDKILNPNYNKSLSSNDKMIEYFSCASPWCANYKI
ncbi:hypothetical protein [Clostridium estertheticum]|uniref:hypothetical protein n=1 Tax=Clostridium estertheticum TaxID=238834 RepID=UPI001CF5CE39|nr:hypothetical protein [Clostridium estertheticum]MCB2354843.1 hypothetical protein [Clostridium estertheticum]WAG41084.1 hypothetical protein LL065_23100 [Clostridium estertheticum]